MFDFLSIRKSLKDFADELGAIRFDIETLTREVEDIQFAPANNGDLFKALEVWATDNQVKYRAHLKTELNKLIRSPGDLAENSSVNRHLYSRGILPTPCLDTPISRDVQMCGLLGPAKFVELVKAQAEAIEWPDPGLLMAERAPAAAKLKKKIKDLRARKADLLRSAEKAGLQVS